MKVLITTDWYLSSVNGVVTSVKNLEKGLKSLGHDVKILTLSGSRQSYNNENVTYVGSVNANKIYPCARIKIPRKSTIIKDIIKWKPDIIHSQCEFSTFFLARKISKITGAPIVHTYHTIYEDYTHYFSPSMKLGRDAVILFTKFISKNIVCFVAPTVKVKDILGDYQIKTPIEIMPTGLDLDMIVSKSSYDDKAELKKKLKINPQNKVILYAGRLAEEKNINEIISYLSKKKPENTTFLIVGDGPYRKDIELKIKEFGLSDMTIMTGMVKCDEIKDYYAIGDVFVSASQSETQGLTYIEALANGVPLLCRSDKCLNNVLIQGYNGYAYTNYEEFSQYLDEILYNQGDTIIENSKKLANEKFSLFTFAENAEKIYLKYIQKYCIELCA